MHNDNMDKKNVYRTQVKKKKLTKNKQNNK